jgi:hypothetical protein
MLRLGTGVVDVTTRGAVPVPTVEVIWLPDNAPVTDKDAPVAAPMFGVIRVGVLARTNDPLPVSSEIALASINDVGE